MKPLIKWPDHEQLYKTMPISFKAGVFRKCIAIIDCFEIFMDRPKGLTARAQTWSNYKSHNTKFLISISPQGSITFVPQGRGGWVSDHHLMENCGILNHLSPGNVILVDQGFNIHNEAGLYCAKVKLPPFTKGKKQLSRVEVDKACDPSRVHIHIERVIGLLWPKV